MLWNNGLAIARTIILSLVLVVALVFVPISIASANPIAAVSSNPDIVAQLEPSTVQDVEDFNPSRHIAQASDMRRKKPRPSVTGQCTCTLIPKEQQCGECQVQLGDGSVRDGVWCDEQPSMCLICNESSN